MRFFGRRSPRYLLFAGSQYYPRGGWHDFQGAFNSLPAAHTAAADLMSAMGRSEAYAWWSVVDLETLAEVEHDAVDT